MLAVELAPLLTTVVELVNPLATCEVVDDWLLKLPTEVVCGCAVFSDASSGAGRKLFALSAGCSWVN